MFAITKDHDHEEFGDFPSRVGTIGPSGLALNYDQIVNHKDGQKFRMLTDDDELIYEGVYVATQNSDEFEPLDCFGMPDFGCTRIEYANNEGEWEQI